MTPHCSACSYGNISIAYIEVCTHTHTRVELEGSQAISFNDTQTLSQGTFPASKSRAAPGNQWWGAGSSSHARQGRSGIMAPHSQSPTGPSRDLLESSFVVVDRLNVTALVFEEIGVVVVHLGVVGQGLHSWAAKRNRSRTVLVLRYPTFPKVHLLLMVPFSDMFARTLSICTPVLQPWVCPTHWYTTCSEWT